MAAFTGFIHSRNSLERLVPRYSSRNESMKGQRMMPKNFMPYCFFLGLFCLSGWAPPGFSAVPDCRQVPEQFDKMLTELKRDCGRAADCRLEDLAWSGCEKPVAHNDPTFADELKKARAESRKVCGFKQGNCIRELTAAACIDRKCQDLADLGSLRGRKLQLLFLKDQRPLKNTKIILTADTGIRCATVPCPSRRDVKTFKTDSNGRVFWAFSEIIELAFSKHAPKTEKLGQSVGPDGYGWVIENRAFQSMDLESLLLKTDEVFEVRF